MDGGDGTGLILSCTFWFPVNKAVIFTSSSSPFFSLLVLKEKNNMQKTKTALSQTDVILSLFNKSDFTIK